MRNLFFRLLVLLMIGCGAPIYAQTGAAQTDQAQQYLSNQGLTGQTSSSDTSLNRS